jgi:hypothetical protein
MNSINSAEHQYCFGGFKMTKPFEGVADPRIWKFSEEWTRLRLIGEPVSVVEFWIPIIKKTGEQICVPKHCLDWDPAKKTRTGSCPYCQAGPDGRIVHYSNAIIRRLQKVDEPTPVRVVRLPPRPYVMLQNLASLNRRSVKSGKAKQYGLAHPKFGRDLRMKVNPDMPYGYYDVQAVENTRLTSDELTYQLTPLTMQLETFELAELFLRNLRAPQAHDL